jgi:hypothetical protein
MFLCEEPEMNADKTKLSRRNFLLAVGASGAAGAAAIVAKTVPQAQPVATAAGKTVTKGYHASAHIRNYYRTAKV